jgi:hypothetical protein
LLGNLLFTFPDSKGLDEPMEFGVFRDRRQSDVSKESWPF